jgi:hypothetical protein
MSLYILKDKCKFKVAIGSHNKADYFFKMIINTDSITKDDES